MSKALITGGSRGLGKSIADALALKGWSCTLVARDEPKLKDTISKLKDPKQHNYVPLDLSKPELIEDAIGPLFIGKDYHLLVNCAGKTDRSLVVNTSITELQSVINTNLTSSLILSKLAAKAMMRRKINGSIINIASVLAERPMVGSVAYVTSKAGMVGMTKALALELTRSKIRCNAILPGLMETDMGEMVNSKLFDQLLQGDVKKDVVDLVMFLVEHESITGSTLTVDNGFTVR
ncbi:unnamed protein product [Kuraishia capsulata CBS 1993]|uniref:3-oxoacyl-[acyl-carrier-protein] reductase n=1 Tax=Kuraishia capsulata CBS 1993 TaxID=1382522 RepID=W6MT36_9ASCO|nr:uncharacterized protein KUCA_T00005515001 [Kuraishia capsulata CBS 1993]CDK29523.1 unnamed protein product [Kuraishia capsulata CBS 1993]